MKISHRLHRLWRQYGIVAAALILSLCGFISARNAPDWFISGLLISPDPPCSRLAAMNGLRVSARVDSVSATLARQCIKIRTDPSGVEQIETPAGTYWVPLGSQRFLPYLLAEEAAGAYNSGSTRVRPGDVVLDGGANIGAFVRVALNAGAEKVIAIEPVPANLECLRRNFEREIAAGRVIVYPKGVWSANAVLPMRLDAISALDSFVLDPGRGRTVINLPLTTIDELTGELRLTRVDYIKLDVEGAEVHALHGARGVLGKDRPRLVVASEHLADDNISIPRAVLAANPGYRVECGACSATGNKIKPGVLHFY